MAFLITMALAVVAGWAPPTASPTDPLDQLKVHAVRFYDASSGLTQVRAFIQVPMEALTPSRNGPDGMLTYQVRIHLRDSLGATLSEDAWPEQHVSAGVRGPGVTTVNSLEFVVRPGKYRLDVNVRDSVSGSEFEASAALAGYAQAPSASDLVLAPGIRALGGDSMPQGTEWRNGSLLVTSAAELVLTPLRSKAFYLLEVYSDKSDSGTMSVRIRDSIGSTVIESRPVPVRLATGGGVLRGQLDMDGLPPGHYDLDVLVQLGAQRFERSGSFRMTEAGPVLARRAAEIAEELKADSGYFMAMDEESLDKAFEPLDYLAGAGELRPYRGLSVSAKRRFLIDFWQKRDPDQVSPGNPAREEFYGKVAYADSAFRERGARTQSGWKTDRGRIFARYGAPDEKLDRVSVGRAPSYQVWMYTRGKVRYYVFSDRSGFGAYKLLTSNDLMEAGAPDWRDILGPDALKDVGQFLNLDFFTTN